MDVIDISLLLKSILSELKRLRQNIELSNYIGQVQNVLNCYKSAKNKPLPILYNPKFEVFSKLNRENIVLSLFKDILIKRGPDFRDNFTADDELPARDLPRDSDSRYKKSKISLTNNSSKIIFELSKILNSFIMSFDVLRQHYENNLKENLTALKNSNNYPKLQEWLPNIQALNWSIEKARIKVHK